MTKSYMYCTKSVQLTKHNNTQLHLEHVQIAYTRVAHLTMAIYKFWAGTLSKLLVASTKFSVFGICKSSVTNFSVYLKFIY